MMNAPVLITGGNRGLGKDMAMALANAGHDIIITYNSNKEMARQTVDQIKTLRRQAAAIHLDMNQPQVLEQFTAELQHILKSEFNAIHIGALVNNAGIGATIPFASVQEQQFDMFMNIHFKSVFFLTQNMLPLIQDNGCIINISSGTTRFCVPGYSVYASMKGAVEIFTKYLAKEAGSRGIRANIIAPGPVETDFNNAAIRNNPAMKQNLAAMSPLGRVGQAEDIGGVVAFLCSPAARWINGQRIEVSGGINI
jgi:NAD(P)-dependent dehydrogenase (short-subunit alcohol dehydrogenase family)